MAGRYRRRYGNLRHDDPQTVVRAALDDEGERSEDALWFDLAPIPDVCELAERHGDPMGERVHLHEESPRRLWLDRAQQPKAR